LNRVLEKLMVTKLVKKFPAFYGTQRFIAVFTGGLLLVLILSQMNSVHNFSCYFPKIQSNITFPSIPRILV